MAFLGSNNNDDYKNDLKPDQSMPNYNDSVSSITWAPPQLPNFFATTSWDGELRVLAIEQGQFGMALFQKMSYKFPSPVLKSAWSDQQNHIYVGLLDGSIKCFDLGSSQVADIGRHNAAISSLHFAPGNNLLVSTAYESTVSVWQPGNPNPATSFNVDNKVFTSDLKFPVFVAGTANEKLFICDITNVQHSRVCADSNDLGRYSQIQSVAINNKCNVFGASSFDGRANLSSISKSVNGAYTMVPLTQYRNRSSPSRATSRRRAETPSSTPSTPSPSIPSTNAGS
jgi:hypothetical protein